MIEYKSYDYTRTIPVDDYILRYRDERRFMAYCRECRRYGNSWSCPPFNDSEDYLSGFRNLLIVCTRITPVVLDVPDAVEAGQELMHRERSRLHKRLLALEEEYNGRAFSLSVSRSARFPQFQTKAALSALSLWLLLHCPESTLFLLQRNKHRSQALFSL